MEAELKECPDIIPCWAQWIEYTRMSVANKRQCLFELSTTSFENYANRFACYPALTSGEFAVCHWWFTREKIRLQKRARYAHTVN